MFIVDAVGVRPSFTCPRALLGTSEYQVENAAAVSTTGGAAVGDAVTITCNTGFRLATSTDAAPVTSQIVTCTSTGRFTPLISNRCICKYSTEI